ncbi:MAG: alpha/beta fold hydrolase [Chloroflexota bacterium]|nr:alpha/beta fold hydrolase [Chloroflexota bacterium]
MSNQIEDSIKAESNTKHILKQVAKVAGIILLSILALVIIIGIIPVSKDGLSSSLDPAASYEEAVLRFDDILAEEKGIVNDAADSQLMTHGEQTERVYVLVHGWTNSPRQFQELGELLYERGNNILIHRIPHHGLESHSVGELKNVEIQDLSVYGDETIDIAAGLGEEVHVIGLSVGGEIASWIAQNREDVERVMVVSPMFGMGHLPSFVDTFLTNLFLRLPNINILDPNEPVRDHVYRGQSTRGVAEAMRFGETVFTQAGNSGPTAGKIILVTNGNDTTVDNRHAEELAAIWENWGVVIIRYEFPKALGFPHNSIDVSEPDTDTDVVYAKILELLGE